MSPVFLILCLIMFGVFYQKGLKFFLALGHSKWRSHIEGALIGILVGFAFPFGVIYYGAALRKPAAADRAASGVQIPGAASDSTAQEAVNIPE
ncbi:MAG: hypothetical protein ACU837_16035 [Gammaproteobacteria bacterium]